MHQRLIARLGTALLISLTLATAACGQASEARAPSTSRVRPQLRLLPLTLPDGQLTDGEEIRVAATGLRPSSLLGAVQCRPTKDGRVDGRCDVVGASAVGSTRPDGTAEATVRVQRVIELQDGTKVDCGTTGDCVVALVEFPALAAAAAAFLTFSTDRPAPSIEVRESDRPGTAELDMRNWQPGPVRLFECADRTEQGAPNCESYGYEHTVEADDSGAFSGQVQLGGWGALPTGPVRCDSPAAGCYLVAEQDGVRRRTSLTVSPIRPDPKPPNEPLFNLEAVLDPSGWRAVGKVEGLEPGARADLRVCRRSDELVPLCGPSVSGTVGDDGSLRVDLLVNPRIAERYGRGTMDCAMGGCRAVVVTSSQRFYFTVDPPT